jgi:serine/threonine protein kinase
MHFQRLAEGACYDPDSVECLDDNAAAEFVSGALAGKAISKVEAHLAGCRECRALVAALAGTGDVDSQAETHKHERITESQAGKLPKKLAVGDRVGRYLVLSTLGAGGMGVVFAAYDPQLDRKVALKVLRANLGANAKEARARLKREAQAIARLSHPNVVGVYEVGAMDDGDVYIAMEFVEGDTLTTWLKRWPRTWREILEVFHQAGRGLAAAHSVGLLHRDFKPDNVLVGGDGRVRVTDFGLARSVLGPDDIAHPRPEASALHAELTATGTVLGTPRYMPPEQLTGPDIDARSDEFSFCVALYEALYGVHPLKENTSVCMIEHGDEAQPPPENTRVPATIGRAVMRGLARERAKRFPTMAVLMSELQPPPERARSRVALFAMLGLVLVAGATAAVYSRNDPPRPPPAPDDATMAHQIAEIKELKAERDRLEAELQKLLKEHDATKQELDDVKQQIIDLNEQYNKALDDLTRLRSQHVGKPSTGPEPLTSKQITATLQVAQTNLEGCFREWSERQALEAIEGFKRPKPDDAELVVKLAITPDGVGQDAVAQGEIDYRRDGTQVPAHGELSSCVEVDVAAVRFPTGPEGLQVDVQVAWTSSGIVNTSARITGREQATPAGSALP